MHWILGFILLWSPLVSQAASDTHCPNNIVISYESLIPVSEQKVERLRRNANPEVYRTAVKARETLIRTPREKVQGLSFKFNDESGGICTYKRSGGGEGALEIFSRAGTEYLRVQLPFRAFEAFTVHQLTRVNERGVKVDYRPTTPIQVKAGSRAYHVGWAYSLSID